MTPKITVVIPTRERCSVLEKALATVTAQDYDHRKILVSGNCSSDQMRDVVAAANDPRIRYRPAQTQPLGPGDRCTNW